MKTPVLPYEPRHEKTCFLQMRKQRRRSAALLFSLHILSKIIKGSANLFFLFYTFKIQNNVCRRGPFEIISYTDEQLGNINGFQKANCGKKIHPEHSEIFVNF